MSAETPGLPAAAVSGGVGSLEVRWIFPGRLEAAVAGWFGRFPAASGQIMARVPGPGQEPGCEVELTGVSTTTGC